MRPPLFIDVPVLSSFSRHLTNDIVAVEDGLEVLPLLLDFSPDFYNVLGSEESGFPIGDISLQELDVGRAGDAHHLGNIFVQFIKYGVQPFQYEGAGVSELCKFKFDRFPFPLHFGEDLLEPLLFPCYFGDISD